MKILQHNNKKNEFLNYNNQQVMAGRYGHISQTDERLGSVQILVEDRRRDRMQTDGTIRGQYCTSNSCRLFFYSTSITLFSMHRSFQEKQGNKELKIIKVTLRIKGPTLCEYASLKTLVVIIIINIGWFQDW